MTVRGGLSLGALTMLTGWDVSQEGSIEKGLRAISSFNDRGQRCCSTPSTWHRPTRLRWCSKPPRFNAYYDIMDVEPVDSQSWKLELSGLIGDKRPWTARQLAALLETDMIIKHVCVEGWSCIGEWSGPTLRSFLERVGADLRAKYVALTTADDCPSSVDKATAPHPQTLLATKHAGDPTGDPFRFPLRLRMATKLRAISVQIASSEWKICVLNQDTRAISVQTASSEWKICVLNQDTRAFLRFILIGKSSSFKNPKWITAIEVTNAYTGGDWEKQGFNWFRGI